MREFIKSKSTFIVLVLFIYISVNSLFILKYGIRQQYISNVLLTVSYVVIFLLGYVLLEKNKSYLNSFRKFSRYFIAISLVVFLIFIIANYYVDGTTLNVLRWKALDTSIESLLKGEYPYTNFLDDQGDTSSNFPGLFVLNFPFYVLGDVGLLQPFTFLTVCYVLYSSNMTNYKKSLVLFLLLLSPAYLWEVFAKSDLMSNMILLVIFMAVWYKRYEQDLFQKPVILGAIVALFVLTRAIVCIPLVLLLCVPFFKTILQRKVYFIGSVLLFLVLIAIPVLITIPDMETFIQYNPFNNQSTETPKIVSIPFLILPFFVAKRITSLYKLFLYSFVLIGALVFTAFIVNAVEEGFYNNLYKSYFDISYLGLLLPFLIACKSLK